MCLPLFGQSSSLGLLRTFTCSTATILCLPLLLCLRPLLSVGLVPSPCSPNVLAESFINWPHVDVISFKHANASLAPRPQHIFPSLHCIKGGDLHVRSFSVR